MRTFLTTLVFLTGGFAALAISVLLTADAGPKDVYLAVGASVVAVATYAFWDDAGLHLAYPGENARKSS